MWFNIKNRMHLKGIIKTEARQKLPGLILEKNLEIYKLYRKLLCGCIQAIKKPASY